MYTVVQPVYEPDTLRVMGIAGVDTTIASVAKIVGSKELAIQLINERNKKERSRCEPREVPSCKMQTLRGDSKCADFLYREDKSWRCFKSGNSYFM